MKRFWKILITLLLIVVAIAITFAVWQRENISALINGLNKSTEDLATEMDNHRENVKNKVEKYVSKPIEDISAEDEKKLLKGEITLEEVADKYKLPIDYLKDDNNESEKTITPTSKPNSEAIDEIISENVSKMYALKAKYVNKLGELERTVYNEYSSLPKEEQNDDSKYKIVKSNLNYLAELEKKCDKEVSLILSDLKEELNKLNGDKEIVKILQDAYNKEKEVKKAYYLSIYNK